MRSPTWTDLVDEASRRRLTISTAESCTGGHISDLITDVPGASVCYLGGYVAYSNDMKRKVLGVSGGTIELRGAVSREAAQEMADLCLEASGSDIALAVTGIAGPGGGTVEKPVGTVYISVAARGKRTQTEGFLLSGLDRRSFKEEVSLRVLGMLLGAVRTFRSRKP